MSDHDEPRRRVWLLLVFLNFTALLLVLLLYPEFAVLARFEQAECTVEAKAPFRFYESQAKIKVNVTVYGENDTQTFTASSCNPMDCDVNGGGFMDKREWLQIYREGESYECLYDPQRDKGGFQWVVFSPPVYTVTLWLVLAVCAVAGVVGSLYTGFQHVRENGLQTQRLTARLAALWAALKGAVVRRAQRIWPWKTAASQGMEMTGRGGVSSESLPPAYEPPPPAYEDFEDDGADVVRRDSEGEQAEVLAAPVNSRGYARLNTAED